MLFSFFIISLYFFFFLKKNEKMKIKWKFTRENVSFLKFSSFHGFSFFHVFFIFGIREVKDGEEKGKLWKFAFSLGSFHFSSFPSIFSFFWRKMKIKWTFTRENASFIKFAFFLFFFFYHCWDSRGGKMERKEETFWKFAFALANVHFYHFDIINKENWENDENETMKVVS